MPRSAFFFDTAMDQMVTVGLGESKGGRDGSRDDPR
jgi:hypothetical protein